ncbi:hypothetical protein [Streptomyces atratus]|uniref:hypothetical protein n=1 Tax=Streptomyces atratus TaxID=1893 RepID=UPI00224E1406|nr:hypothetical protein [Streptomyces atratus]MCX5345477.1 hypothetical protein [Streptomyces atratus]
MNARSVAEAGAGTAVTPAVRPADESTALGPDDVSRIRSAVELVLKKPSYRARATATGRELIGALEPHS